MEEDEVDVLVVVVVVGNDWSRSQGAAPRTSGSAGSWQYASLISEVWRVCDWTVWSRDWRLPSGVDGRSFVLETGMADG